ncbi:MAG: bifunctional phosphopantothenoylcysteine decarboxylase/phosphopantothenate--cysteine ligase CoaBC [Bacteroidota bacterium]|jgi:phosphopantothenoylcysteine decarboxylase/phosphopantothenate--cysteine ligase
MLRKSPFKHKKILIGITGGIAAYKIPQLVRILKKEGAEVQVVLSESAKSFVTPQTLSVLSEKPALSDFFKSDQGEWNNHVHLGLWADLILIAPAGANTLAKMSHGICDNLLMSVILSARCPIFVAPAMDLDMWTHPSTQSNIQTLVNRGVHMIEPEEGSLASGLEGKGRMAEPENIAQVLSGYLAPKPNYFLGKRVLVTAGGTQEPIDPVRYIGNHSSGKMGFAIAEQLIQLGAEVELVYGAVTVVPPTNCQSYQTRTAKEMKAKCDEIFPTCDVLIMAAAVADYHVVDVAAEKIKKTDDTLMLTLAKNPDILKSLSEAKKEHQVLIGFALETEQEEFHALEKLQKKNLDCIVLNSLKNPKAGFAVDTNEVTLFCKDGEQYHIPTQQKDDVAAALLNKIGDWLSKTTP